MFIGEHIKAYEACQPGKPDQLDANIAHLIGARFLEINQDGRFNVRVTTSYSDREQVDSIDVFGEVSRSLVNHPHIEDELSEIVRDHVEHIHRKDASDIDIKYRFKEQSDPLAGNNLGAGDSGTPIAVAFKDTPSHEPWERHIAVDLRNLFDSIYQNNGEVPEDIAQRSGITYLPGLRSDGKIEVIVGYDGAELTGVKYVTVAAEHSEALSLGDLREASNALVQGYLSLLAEKTGKYVGKPDVEINGLDEWHNGGWRTDAGLSEAKPQVAYFGSWGIMEDAPWGEDPTKPSGTGTLVAWSAARDLVEEYDADAAHVLLHYRIGSPEPAEIGAIVSRGGVLVDGAKQWLRNNIDLQFTSAIEKFGLKDPDLYRKVAGNSDLFHDRSYAWNQSKTLLLPAERAA